MVEVTCPNCGVKIKVKGTGGRKRKSLNVIFICDALRNSSTVDEAADKLRCSRGYIYKVLKEHGLKPSDFVGKQTQYSKKE
jgi:excisionase family DNA binding protein